MAHANIVVSAPEREGLAQHHAASLTLEAHLQLLLAIGQNPRAGQHGEMRAAMVGHAGATTTDKEPTLGHVLARSTAIKQHHVVIRQQFCARDKSGQTLRRPLVGAILLNELGAHQHSALGVKIRSHQVGFNVNQLRRGLGLAARNTSSGTAGRHSRRTRVGHHRLRSARQQRLRGCARIHRLGCGVGGRKERRGMSLRDLPTVPQQGCREGKHHHDDHALKVHGLPNLRQKLFAPAPRVPALLVISR